MTHQIIANTNGQRVAAGTAWPISSNLIVTAFHVVGSNTLREWRQATFSLTGRDDSLTPILFDPDADVALLYSPSPFKAPLRLASSVRRHQLWHIRAFRESDIGHTFALDGSVTDIFDDVGARGIQLRNNYGVAKWDGISGSAVCETESNEVLALVTRANDDAPALWAVHCATLRRLADVATLLLTSVESSSDNERLFGTDVHSLATREHPFSGSRASDLREKVRAVLSNGRESYDTRAFDELTRSTAALYHVSAEPPTNQERQLLSLLALDSGDTLSAVSTQIELHTGGGVLQIEGAPGTGKSWTMQRLYAERLERFIDGRTRTIPLYIDLATYDEHIYAATERNIEAQAIDLLDSHLTEITAHLGTLGSRRVSLFLDNCDEYRKFGAALRQRVQAWMADQSPHGVVVTSTRQAPEESTDDAHGVTARKPTPLLTLSPASFTDPRRARAIIEAYLRVKNLQLAADIATRVLAVARRLQLDLDLFSLRLLVEYIQRTGKDPASLSVLYFDVCRQDVEQAARLAFTYYVDRRHLPEHDLHSHRGSWRLVHLHPLLLDFLVAHRIKQAITTLVKARGPHLPKRSQWAAAVLCNVFPARVMRRCKELLTTEKDRCRDVLDVLRWAVKFRHYGVMSTLCYLAGRIAIASLTRTAMLLLEDVKRLLDDTGEVSTTIDVPLLQRTVYVSLASLGHENAAQEYIDRLVKKPSWDALNRGFHMEYYGDREYDPSRPIHRDDLRACPRTARALIDRFSSENGMRDIEFYTFCSLVRHRHAARAPIPVHDASDIIRARLPRVASPSIRAYANSTLEELSIPLFSPGHVIDQMYQLKHFRRSGWNYRDDARTRNVDNAESIADHMYAAYLLAFMLLPRSDPNPEYSKTRVCQMLLFHDIGEARSGDVPRWQKRAEHVERERAWVSYLASLAMLDGFDEDVAAIRKACEEFDSNESTNARIAQDLDKLENLVQLYIYKRGGAEISDFVNWRDGIVDRIQTTHGQNILRVIRAHFEPLAI